MPDRYPPVPRRRPTSTHRTAAEPLEPRRLFTTAVLLADLDTVPSSAGLIPQVVAGGTLYCTRAGTDGDELWRTDGTAAGTVRLEETSAANLTALGSSVLYTVGTELWETDGTPGDARLVRQFQPGTSPLTDVQWHLYPLGSRMAVLFDDGSLATGLYVTDATSAGTTLVRQGLVAGDAPQPVVQVGGTDFLATTDGLWRTDGTAAGTVEVDPATVAALGAAGSQAVYLTEAAAETAVRLWAVGPAATAPTPIDTFGPYGSAFLDAAGADLSDRFTFSLSTEATTTTPVTTTLWTTDGTAAGTTQVAAALPADMAVNGIVAAGPLDYFTVGSDFVTDSVWVTDGTAGGTAQVLADPAVAGSVTLLNIAAAEPDGSAELRVTDIDYPPGFSDTQPPAKDDVYHTDGTATGTVRVAVGPADTAFSQFVPFDGGLYMTATTSNFDGSTPVVSAVTGWMAANLATADSAGPFDPSVDELASSDPRLAAVTGDYAYFTAASDPNGVRQLWRTDGTPAGTVQLTELPAGALTYDGGVVVGDDLYFQPRTDDDNGDLWKSDGTAAGTAAVPLPSALADSSIIVAGTGGTYLYFTVPGTETTAALWRTDGTTAGTTEVADVYTFNSVDPLTDGGPAGGRFVFEDTVATTAGGTDTYTRVLRSTDGTAAGTATIFQSPDAYPVTDQAPLTPLGDRLLFLTSGAAWATDGTAAGTVQLATADFSSGAAITVVGGFAYLRTAGGQTIRTDGTPAGTAPFADPLDPTADLAVIGQLGGQVLYTRSDATDHTQVWSTDGSAAGTALAADVDTGSTADYLSGATVVGGQLLFVAPNASGVATLYQSDGTPAGTAPAIDSGLVAHPFVSGTPLPVVGGSALFTVDDGVHGDELWHTVPGTPTLSMVTPPKQDPAAVPVPVPPTATLAAPTVTAGATGIDLAITYADANPVAIGPITDPATISLTRASGTALTLTVASTDETDPTHPVVTYRWQPPTGTVTSDDNGTYAVALATDDVTDVFGAALAAGPIGTFTVALPVVVPKVTGPGVTATVTGVTGPAVGGGRGVARVRLTNVGTAPSAGSATLGVSLATADVPGVGMSVPITVAPATIPVRLRPGQSRTVAVRFDFPDPAGDGTRYVLATLTGPDAVAGVTTASPAVAYRAASVDLSATAAAAKGHAGKRATVVLRVHNAGSVTAAGTVSFGLSLAGGSLAAAVTLPAVTRPVSVRAGATKAVAVPFTVPAGLAAGTYKVTVTLSPTTSPADGTAADKTVVVPLTVG